MIQTGFVETLKPQYTPGPALSPGIGFNVEERLTNLQQATEIDRLHVEIRDLNEKLETLRGWYPFYVVPYLVLDTVPYTKE